MVGVKSTGMSPLTSLLGLNGPFQKGLMFLLQLAWESRLRLPLLITVGFMVLDIRMQLEINVDIDMRGQHNEDHGEDEDEEEEEEHGDIDDDDVERVVDNRANSDRGESAS